MFPEDSDNVLVIFFLQLAHSPPTSKTLLKLLSTCGFFFFLFLGVLLSLFNNKNNTVLIWLACLLWDISRIPCTHTKRNCSRDGSWKQAFKILPSNSASLKEFYFLSFLWNLKEEAIFLSWMFFFFACGLFLWMAHKQHWTRAAPWQLVTELGIPHL